MPDASHNLRPLRLASYNIRKAKGVDGRYDPGRIVDILAGLSADVVAVQEVDFRWRGRPGALSAQMIAEHTDYDIVPVGADGNGLGWHGNAVLVRRGTHVRQVIRLTLPGLEPRGALRVDLGLGGGISIVATHLGLTRYHRQAQLAAIRAAVDPDAQASVVLGDFNEWSAKRGLDPLRDDFTIHAPGKSFHAALPMAALDRIALSRDVTLTDGGVVQTRQSLKASDHLPVWGEVVVNRRNQG
ncbi:endonuclease/exonuclease/phosphatase family protein [Yoonia sp.]|uniref:endonuclease/exonuclease/phosphatase family protein n=1 Tax=Yoonia sp. TaxID=2212373 RepID=UPI00391D936A